MAEDALTEEHKQQIVSAIEEAETNTSGEIRVHIENHCAGDAMNRAAKVFATLHMHETQLRNGVLFYLALKDHKFAILGDAGINQKVPEHFWEDIRDYMREEFKQGHIAQGLAEGIKRAGQQLKTHFPYQQNDTNELSDDISFGK